MYMPQFEKLIVQSSPLLRCDLPAGKSPWDDDGIFTFSTKYDRFYIEDVKPRIDPCFGMWFTQKPQLTHLGAINIVERSILVSNKILPILSHFRLAPHVIYTLPYEIKYAINSQWNETGEYYLLFFYTSAFNNINWQYSTFFQHVHTEEEIVVARDLKFESSESFTKVYPTILIEKGYNFTPQELVLNFQSKPYDLFGLFYINNYLIISEACSNALRKAKAYSRYNKGVPLNFKLGFN